MTKKELDYLAEKIVSLIQEKQSELDKEFFEKLHAEAAEKGFDVEIQDHVTFLEAELDTLVKLHQKLMYNEEYEKLKAVEDKIEVLSNELKKYRK